MGSVIDNCHYLFKSFTFFTYTIYILAGARIFIAHCFFYKNYIYSIGLNRLQDIQNIVQIGPKKTDTSADTVLLFYSFIEISSSNTGQ